MIDPDVDCSAAAFIHPTACIYGAVTLGEGASIWPHIADRMNAWMYHRNALAYARGAYREWESPAFRAEVPKMQAQFEQEFAQRWDADETP